MLMDTFIARGLYIIEQILLWEIDK
jgi:hypothetical protein